MQGLGDCPACKAPLETPLGCQACGVLLSVDESASPFELFGLPRGYALDAAELKRRLLRFSRLTHPDFFGSKPAAERERAERNTALLNRAHGVLADPPSRADWLVTHGGGPSEADERAMPQAFLMEVLEWNEAVDAARDAAPRAPERAALDGLERTLRDERTCALARIAALLEPLPARGAAAYTQARKELNALRYLDKTLSDIAALRLEQAAAR
jgi:molecular chaperone HscB